MEEKGSRGWVPAGVAAGAVYLAGLLNDVSKSQKEISRVVGVSKVTVRIRYLGILSLFPEFKRLH